MWYIQCKINYKLLFNNNILECRQLKQFIDNKINGNSSI